MTETKVTASGTTVSTREAARGLLQAVGHATVQQLDRVTDVVDDGGCACFVDADGVPIVWMSWSAVKHFATTTGWLPEGAKS